VPNALRSWTTIYPQLTRPHRVKLSKDIIVTLSIKALAFPVFRKSRITATIKSTCTRMDSIWCIDWLCIGGKGRLRAQCLRRGIGGVRHATLQLGNMEIGEEG